MTLGKSIFLISDGTTTFDLMGLNPIGWAEVLPEWKNGGAWQSSPFNDGDILTVRSFSNTNDVFNFNPKDVDQNALIARIRVLVSLLEKAVAYGTSEWAVDPVWIKVQGECEDHPIYALIRGYAIPQMDDPTFAPFANGAIEGFILALSHDIWQSEQPQTSTCVPISGQQTYHSQAIHNPAVETLGENYAAEYYTGQREIENPSTTDFRVRFGVFQNIIYYNKSSALRFYLTGIPRRSQVTAASLTVFAADNVAATDVIVKVTTERGSTVNGEFITLPILGITGTELVARPRLSPYVDWTINAAWVANNPYTCAGMEDIIQAIIDQPEWTGEGWINIYIENQTLTTAGRYRSICTDDSAGGDFPYLTLSFYPEDETYGREETCLDEVIVANKHNWAQINEVWFWDDSGGAIHDVLAGHVFPSVVDLAHVTPAVDDWWVFGVAVAGLNDEGPFSNIILDMYDTPTMPIEGDWAFFDGATHTWIAFDEENICDGTNGFSKPGIGVISFIPPGSISGGYMHITTPAGGVSGLYVRFKITAVPAGIGMAPSIHNRAPYTCCWPYVDIANDSIPGDIAALAKSFLWPKTMCNHVTGEYPYNSFYLATRSISRGADFSAYINLTDRQNPVGISIGAGPGAFVDTADDATTPWGSPTGNWAVWSAGGVGWSNPLTIIFSYEIASQYRGKYAAYLRCVEFNGVFAPNYNVRAKLAYRFGRESLETDPVPIYQWDGTEESVRYFMGYIDLGPELARDELLDGATINIWLDNDDVGAMEEVWLMDLILVPVDEYAVYVDVGSWDPNTGAWPFTSDYVDIDSIKLRKTGGTRGHLVRNVYSWMNWGFSPGIAKTLLVYTEGPWRLPNNSESRVWYFSLHNPYLVVSEQHFINSRYLFSRGDG